MRLAAVLVLTIAAGSALAQERAGTITGTVFDAQTGNPVRGVQVAIDGQTGSELVTDLDGKFTIRIAPGTYRLSFAGPNYVETSIDEVVVASGEVVEASTVMVNESSVTSVEVVAEATAVATTAAALLTERRLSAVVSDSISSIEIKNSIASDAAGAVEKVTGVSVQEGGFVFVRGLGERYSSTMLNNAMLPTTEPERRVVPLDLFPSSLIDSIKVLKTYSADLPGEFSGGLIQMNTIEFPTAPAFNVSVSYGYNSQTTFKDFRNYEGGGRDFFGFEDGSRALPDIIPEDRRLFVGSFTEQEFQQFGRAFNPDYETRNLSSMRPSQSYSISGGNTWGRLGVVGAVTLSNSPQRTPSLRRFLRNFGDGQPFIFSDYDDFNTETQGVRLGAVFNAAYRLSANHKLIWRNTLTRDSDKEARVFTGLNGGNDQIVQSTRLGWIERGLVSTGVEGDHAVPRIWNSLFHWQFTYSTSERNQPDLRETIRGREVGSTGAFRFLNLPESGLRFFSALQDKIYEPQADWSVPFYGGGVSGLVKVGFRGTIRRRDFQSRRFRYFPIRAQTIDFTAPTNEVLSIDNIRPDGFVLREITRATDTYDATMDIFGGYAMLDLAMGPRWRLVGGVRVEDANIGVSTIDALIPNAAPQVATLVNRDPLPTVNVIYALSARQNLRFGYGRTVNRPDFRELSPFEFTNIVGGYSTVGNPELQRAKIDNYDARWEWFLGGNELLAASFFYKDFTDPIEQIYRPTASELRQSFINVAGARNLGIELEIRKNLGFIHSGMAQFAVQANLTFVDSNVEIPIDRFPQLTSRERPLVGQSRFISNATVEWVRPQWRSNARFYVNSVSRRLTDVGTFQLPDVYQERTTFLDAVYEYSILEGGKLTLRFGAENLTNNNYQFMQADILVQQFRTGRVFTVGTRYSFF